MEDLGSGDEPDRIGYQTIATEYRKGVADFRVLRNGIEFLILC